MAESRSKTQFAMPGITPAGPSGEEDTRAFGRGLQVGRDAAQLAMRRIAAWAEEHPGQMVLAGVALGFVLGKLLLGRRRPVVIEELD
jgi:hypothetical protein